MKLPNCVLVLAHGVGPHGHSLLHKAEKCRQSDCGPGITTVICEMAQRADQNKYYFIVVTQELSLYIHWNKLWARHETRQKWRTLVSNTYQLSAPLSTKFRSGPQRKLFLYGARTVGSLGSMELWRHGAIED